jgi:hypothetical protein
VLGDAACDDVPSGVMTEAARRATVCRLCGGELWDVVGRGVHPLCADERELWWTAADIGAAARMIARRAEPRKPLPDKDSAESPNAAVNAVCSLLVGDPSNRRSLEEVVYAIVRSAADDIFWRTTANTMRPYIPHATNPAMIGATVRTLVQKGILSETGRYVRCTDRTAGNYGKPQKVYELNADLLERMMFGGDG